MYELQCQTINRKCVLDRHLSHLTPRTMYQNSLHLGFFGRFFQIKCKNVKSEDFLDLQ